MEKDIECVNSNNQIRYIPESLAKRPDYMHKHKLRVQDIEAKQEEVKELFAETKQELAEAKEEVKEDAKPEEPKKNKK